LNYFYSVLLILLGILLLVRYVFKIKIPIFLISTAIILIILGVSLFVNGPGIGSENNIVFSKNRIIQAVNPSNEYTFVFANGTIDLTKTHPQNIGQKIKINTIFSNGTIKVNPQTPLIVKTHSAFAVTETPNKDLIYFGSSSYQTKSFKKESEYIDIDAKVIFGMLTVEEDIKPST